MKRIFLLAMIGLGFCFSSVAQETEENGVDWYVSAGLSMGNTGDTTFAYSSYPWVEAGLMKNNFTFGMMFGRGNLSGFDNDMAENYWYEAKVAYGWPMGNFTGYGLMGIGNYISTSRIFIEYGVGASYCWDHWGVGTQVTNWDGYWYATPFVSYTF